MLISFVLYSRRKKKVDPDENFPAEEEYFTPPPAQPDELPDTTTVEESPAPPETVESAPAESPTSEAAVEKVAMWKYIKTIPTSTKKPLPSK